MHVKVIIIDQARPWRTLLDRFMADLAPSSKLHLDGDSDRHDYTKGTKSSASAVANSARTTAKPAPQEAAQAKPPTPVFSGIVIRDVRVRNYRCLRSVDVELDQLTVLIGQNNAGKTSFLNALFAAIGAGQRIISGDDVFLQKTEVPAPKDRPIAIDILSLATESRC
jgi:hypothetical protein